MRPRVCSLPERPYNPRASDDLYRLRHFSISKGNVVNCGDSIISRRSRSNTSVNSTNSRASERSPFEGSCCGAGYANVDSLPASPDESENLEAPPPARYRVVMLGDAGVGKTALVNQFMTSEYMHTYDASLGKLTVSIPRVLRARHPTPYSMWNLCVFMPIPLSIPFAAGFRLPRL